MKLRLSPGCRSRNRVLADRKMPSEVERGGKSESKREKERVAESVAM
jgi:hypothetical protein